MRPLPLEPDSILTRDESKFSAYHTVSQYRTAVGSLKVATAVVAAMALAPVVEAAADEADRAVVELVVETVYCHPKRTDLERGPHCATQMVHRSGQGAHHIAAD